MKTQKHPYTAPAADLFVVRFEENFLASGDMAINPFDPNGEVLNVPVIPDFNIF